MPTSTPMDIPRPSPDEELRQWAQAFADLHHVLDLIVKDAAYFVPGEAVDELIKAWDEAKESAEDLVQTFKQGTTPGTDYSPIPPDELEKNQLILSVGDAKKSIMRRFKDRVLACLKSLPRTPEIIRRAALWRSRSEKLVGT